MPTPSIRSLFDAHAPFVWRVLARAGVRDADLQDALQETFVVVAQKLDQLDAEIRPTTWLYGIAVRVAANQRRKARRKREDFVADASDGPSERPSDNPEIGAARREARAELAELLAVLSDDQRLVFELFELEDLSCPEIAERVGAPLGTVYTRLRTARIELARAARERSGGVS